MTYFLTENFWKSMLTLHMTNPQRNLKSWVQPCMIWNLNWVNMQVMYSQRVVMQDLRLSLLQMLLKKDQQFL